ncbi:glutamyl-tRNA amidotransferase [Pseudomonas lini]|nr:glutamyl-tRNA amidotransferase [Pseudomonas lini]MDT9673167.1 glutamyl-tRNA amidotransferase [Pseudomonas sp. JV414]NSX07319.1 glutamyl-tRNA amidotransferase [Pseudomonas lini]
MRTMSETIEALKHGNVSALELVHAALRKNEMTEHVFISLLESQALSAARQSMARRQQGETLNAADGIPFAVKDLIDVADSRTTAGSLTRNELAPVTQDAPVIARLRNAGMIPIGKTNLTEFAYSGLGLNPHYGTPTADFKPLEARAPGGSSSGSAIAVQRGIVCVAIGTDTAGSIRVPAAFNGLTGFKGSSHRYDMSGIHPLAVTFDSLGCFAHSVQDCVTLDRLMRGVSGPSHPSVDLRDVHFVVETQILEDPELQPAVRANFLATLDLLERAGAHLHYRALASVSRTREAIKHLGWLGAIEAWRLLGGIVESPDGLRLDRRVRNRLLVSAALPATIEAELRLLRSELMQKLSEELNGAILLMPTVKHVAPPLAALEADDALFATTNLRTLAYTMIGSFLDMPGLAIPSGVDPQGLPTSVLISALQGRDDDVLGVGIAVELLQKNG